MDSKQVNNQLVRQNLEYLKQHPEIQRYVFPTGKPVIDACHEVETIERKSVCTRAAYIPICVNKDVQTRHQECTTKIQEDLNNIVWLDHKRGDIKWSRSKPETPSGGKIFCYPEGDYEQVARGGAYTCKNAIGITDSVMKSGNYTFIGLGRGDDQVRGFPDSPHIFLVGDGNKQYSGGNKDELFILAGNDITGTLYGHAGIDTIELLEESFSGYNMTPRIDLTVGGYRENYGRIESGYNATYLYIRQIEHIIGRAKTEVINWYGGSYIIESKGGLPNQPDNITLKAGEAEDRVAIVIDRSSNVFNKALKGHFYYKIHNSSALVDLSYSNLYSTDHTFYLDYGIVDIQDIAIASSNSLGKTITTVRFDLRGDNASIYIKDTDLRKLIYHFKDGTEVTVSGNNLYSTQDSNEFIEKIIQEYPVIAHRLRMFMVIRSVVNNETVSIGNGAHEVISNDALRKSHLIGGAGEDIYVVTSGHKKLNNSGELKIPEIVIYNVNGLNQTDTIDLRQLSQQIARDLDSTLIESIRKDNNDILIELFMPGNDVQEIRDVTTIRLKDAIENKWYERLQVILDSAVKKINYSNDKFALISEPIVFGNDIEVIVIGERDIDWQIELVIPKKIGQYSFYYVKDDANHGNKDLVITNMFDSSVGKENWCSVLLSNFYNTVDKMQTVHIKFADKEMTLKDELTEINKAREYIDQLGQYRSKIYSAIFDQLDSQMMNSTSCTLADHHLSRRELSKELDKEIGKLDIRTLKAVKYLLLNGGELYDSTGVHKSLGFNSMEEQRAFIKEYEDYSEEEIKHDMRSKEDHAGKAVILLLSKSYNELLCLYANIEEQEIRNKIDKCFEYILSKRDIHRIVKQVYEAGALNKLLKFMDNHQHEIQERMEIKAAEYWSDDMSSEYDDAIYDRQRRAVDQEKECVSSSASIGLKPIGYSIVSWIKEAVSQLTGINPAEQIKENVELNVDDAQEKTTLNDVDAMHNELYRGNDLEYLCALTNNVVDNSKLLEIGYKVAQLLDRFAGNGSTTIIKEVNYDLLDKQGNLLLLDVLMCKKNGEKYKCQQEQNIISSNNLDSEYAQSLAYRGYVAQDKLSSVSNNNMPCMVGDDIEDMGLVGVN